MTLSIDSTEVFSWILYHVSNIENEMVKAERITHYLGLKREDNRIYEPISITWPSKAEIVFQNLCVSYNKNLDFVLKGISFKIESNSKIGIVGRTGSGKSTMVLSLFRMVDFAIGTIYIDSIDIKKIDLKTLRNGIAIIPQDPTIFQGSLRFNLDPFDEYDDNEIWKALEVVEMKKKLKKILMD